MQKSDDLVVGSNKSPTLPAPADPVEEFHETMPESCDFRLVEVFRTGVDAYTEGVSIIPGDQAAWNKEVDTTIDEAVTLPDLRDALKVLLKKVRFV